MTPASIGAATRAFLIFVLVECHSIIVVRISEALGHMNVWWTGRIADSILDNLFNVCPPHEEVELVQFELRVQQLDDRVGHKPNVTLLVDR
uniref:Putative secreted peptide n=1 Tax=Anopheles braziliensis TaxID=58242 RepID=A0A2M3ZQ78_9DIPT